MKCDHTFHDILSERTKLPLSTATDNKLIQFVNLLEATPTPFKLNSEKETLKYFDDWYKYLTNDTTMFDPKIYTHLLNNADLLTNATQDGLVSDVFFCNLKKNIDSPQKLQKVADRLETCMQSALSTIVHIFGEKKEADVSNAELCNIFAYKCKLMQKWLLWTIKKQAVAKKTIFGHKVLMDTFVTKFDYFLACAEFFTDAEEKKKYVECLNNTKKLLSGFTKCFQKRKVIPHMGPRGGLFIYGKNGVTKKYVRS